MNPYHHHHPHHQHTSSNTPPGPPSHPSPASSSSRTPHPSSSSANPSHRRTHSSSHPPPSSSRHSGMNSADYPQHSQAPIPPGYPGAGGFSNYPLPGVPEHPAPVYPNAPESYPRATPYASGSRPQSASNSSPPSYARYGFRPQTPQQQPPHAPPGYTSGYMKTSPEDVRRELAPPQPSGRSQGQPGGPPFVYGSYGYDWQQGRPPPGLMPGDSQAHGHGQRRASSEESPDGSSPRPGSSSRKGERHPVFKIEQQDEEDGDEEKIDHRKRKRNRTIRSCVPCHNHKRKCDRKRPCGRCTALGLTGTCVYEVDEQRDMSDPTVIETDRLRKRIAELEQVVRELRQRNPHRGATSSNQANNHTEPQNAAQLVEHDEKGGDKKRRVIVDRFARFKLDEAAMAALHSSRAHEGHEEKVKTSSREGSPEDRKVGTGERSEPYETYLLPGEEMVSDKSGRKTFLGSAAGKSMLRKLAEITTGNKENGPPGGGNSDLLTVPEDAAFTGWFPDTRRTFPFTTIWSHENFSVEIIGLLPTREQSEILWQSWDLEVNSFFHAWHVPTLQADYQRFFAMSPHEQVNVPLPSLAVFLMICSLGCVMRATKAEIFGHPDATSAKDKSPMDPKDLTSSRLQSELYLSGCYQALRLCSFLSNPSVQTIQAQIMVNIYLLTSERAADSWAQTGSLIRQCVAMGLHVDPLTFDPNMTIREAEVRRRIWWTVAGFDALLCLSFGRPSAINFYKTNLPQDCPDSELLDAPCTPSSAFPPFVAINREVSDMTFHSAYYHLAIPTHELLDRSFHVDRKYSRSAIYGWFCPDPEASRLSTTEEEDERHTYDGAVRLAKDVFQWYSHLPRGIRFEPDEDLPDVLRGKYTPTRVNQILALCLKTFMIVMVLHRPYLRADPTAYPESTELCLRAAQLILAAYRVGAYSRASIIWSWWTMSYRAFHAGTVCAFIAIREPDTERSKQCMEDLRGAIAVLEHRSSTWHAAHPVQGDLCNGLVKLDKLATTAVKQASQRQAYSREHKPLQHWTPATTTPNMDDSGGGSGFTPDFGLLPGTPMSQIRAFPEGVSPVQSSQHSSESGRTGAPSPVSYQPPQAENMYFAGDGFSGPESFALPQFWASMFGIKMEDAPAMIL